MLKFKEFLNEDIEEERREVVKKDIYNRVKKFISMKWSNSGIDNYLRFRISSLLHHNKLKNELEKRSQKLFNLRPFVRKEDFGYGGFLLKYENNNVLYFNLLIYELSTPYGNNLCM